MTLSFNLPGGSTFTLEVSGTPDKETVNDIAASILDLIEDGKEMAQHDEEPFDDDAFLHEVEDLMTSGVYENLEIIQ